MPNFFNNTGDNTLFNKLRGIAGGMANFDRFLAVAGYFRSSGYFKLRAELGNVQEIKILVGINVDELFRKHNRALLFNPEEEKVKELYEADFREDVINAKYTPEVEAGILQMYDDLKDHKLEMRIHRTKNLHAKFYLCLPKEYNDNTDGWVIMGSSNISISGLGISNERRYELNVAMKDNDDVAYCLDEFNELWEESVPLTEADIEQYMQKTYLGCQPTPYEIYIKVLIDTFGNQVEDDFVNELPEDVRDFKYQRDAVIQGYQMMMQHNGVLLADVVGLGKTIIATMIAKRFIEANGRRDTQVLVVCPPAIVDNWKEWFQKFKITRNAQFITNGSLSKVLEGKEQYRKPEEFAMIIVDEAHGFRNAGTNRYDELQRICKAPCIYPGMLGSERKKVILLSATPINNNPEDLLNLLRLFQHGRSCSIDGIPNLNAFFRPHINRYNELKRERQTPNVTEDVNRLYDEIRPRVIDKITVRRTRTNILNDPEYMKDMEAQGFKFPTIAPPQEKKYQMDENTSALFYATLQALTDEKAEQHLTYARYRAIEFLTGARRQQYPNAKRTSDSLKGIYRVHMVKRLESSFCAFKHSLATLHRITCDMIRMYEQNSVLIAPELNIKRLLEQGMDPDEIIALAMEKRGIRKDEISFSSDDFSREFIDMLRNDRDVLQDLIDKWNRIDEDPKLELFCHDIQTEYLAPKINPTGKLVVFSESVDTLNYLYKTLREKLLRDDVLLVTAANRGRSSDSIKKNFDANSVTKDNDYNILLASDVLAEGVNLHRANVIINYDSPWNATRLMQRIGRVNRIGTQADCIYNFLFYPSDQGDNEIQLYKNALVKLQSFHSAFGEDAQIFSREEIVRQFQLYNSNIEDDSDQRLALMREVRELYTTNRDLYNKIKNLPGKSRVMREVPAHTGKTLAFVSSPVKKEYYLCDGEEEPRVLDLLQMVEYIKANPEELPATPNITQDNNHFKHVEAMLNKFIIEHIEANNNVQIENDGLDIEARNAINILRNLERVFKNHEVTSLCALFITSISNCEYAALPKTIKKRIKEINDGLDVDQLLHILESLAKQYNISPMQQKYELINTDPCIIISETFI